MAAIERYVAWLRGRLGAVLALAVAWIAVTATSAGRAVNGDAWIGVPSFEWLSYVVAAAMVLGLLLLVVAVVVSRGPGGPPALRRRRYWPLLILLLVVVAAGPRDFSGFNDEGAEQDPEAEASVETDLGDERSIGQLAGGELVILLMMLGAASAVIVWSRWRSQDEQTSEIGTEDTLETILAPAVERAGRHLLSDADPRSSVLLAYADLESALSDAGHPPATHETPSEHLERVLRRLRVDRKPLLRLAELYQRARFSHHVISSEEQRDAGAALRQVQSQLVTSR